MKLVKAGQYSVNMHRFSFFYFLSFTRYLFIELHSLISILLILLLLQKDLLSDERSMSNVRVTFDDEEVRWWYEDKRKGV